MRNRDPYSDSLSRPFGPRNNSRMSQDASLSFSSESVLFATSVLQIEYVILICTYRGKKSHRFPRRMSPTTSARVTRSRVFSKLFCAFFRTDDIHPLMLELIGHLCSTG